MSEKIEILKEYIAQAQAEAVVEQNVYIGELTVTVQAQKLHSFVEFLKSDEKCQFQQLLDICGADYPERSQRFDVVYNFLSMKLNQRIRVKVAADENTPVASLTDIYSSAGWYERETFDLYGIKFSGNPDLRRILTDYNFEGYPLRKDFPLTGFTELRYDEAQRKIVEEPVKLMQDYRNFDFTSPWEAMTSIQEKGNDKGLKPKAMGGKE